MKKTLLTGFITGSLVGLVFGSQQSTSILLSSFHDLAVFPKTSLVAIGFILLLHMLFWGFLGGIFSLVWVRWKKESNLVPTNIGFAFFLMVFVFLFGRFYSVFYQKKVMLLVGGIAVISGLFTGFLFFTAIEYLKKRKKAWQRLSRLVNIFVVLILAGLILFIGSLTIDHSVNGLPGLPRKPRLKKEASLEKPNVILITIDALRADHLGFNGYQEGVSPYLDEMAKKGVIFEEAFANAPWTLPSLSSMFSSRLPTEIKMSVDNLSLEEIKQTNRLTEQVETMAERMQTLGYNTQAIFTNEWLSEPRGFSQGFDGFLNLEKLMPYHYHFHFKNMALTLLLNKIPGMERNLELFYTFLVGPSGQKQFTTRAWEINRWTIPWLEDFQDDRFFLWLHYIDPHAPYDPGENYSPDLNALDLAREQELRQASAHQPEEIRWREIDKQALISLYDGDISLVDAAVGEVWQTLERLNLLDKSIVIVTSDHGEEFWDHGGMGHGRTLYRETIRVPLVIIGPGFQAQRVSKSVTLLDLYPTIIDLIGEKAPREITGQSFKPLIEGKELKEREIIAEGTGRGTERRTIIQGDYKLIYDYFTQEERLYQVRTDTEEKFDLAKISPLVVSQYKNQLFTIVDQARENREEIFKEAEDAGPPLGDVVGY